MSVDFNWIRKIFSACPKCITQIRTEYLSIKRKSAKKMKSVKRWELCYSMFMCLFQPIWQEAWVEREMAGVWLTCPLLCLLSSPSLVCLRTLVCHPEAWHTQTHTHRERAWLCFTSGSAGSQEPFCSQASRGWEEMRGGSALVGAHTLPMLSAKEGGDSRPAWGSSTGIS